MHNTLFWLQDQSHCTETGFNTIDNSDKPLVLKELKKLWEKEDPNLPWDKGVYDKSNTLLLDDSPYKALRNPVSYFFFLLLSENKGVNYLYISRFHFQPNTAIFPYTYSYRNTKDKGLGKSLCPIYISLYDSTYE